MLPYISNVSLLFLIKLCWFLKLFLLLYVVLSSLECGFLLFNVGNVVLVVVVGGTDWVVPFFLLLFSLLQ